MWPAASHVSGWAGFVPFAESAHMLIDSWREVGVDIQRKARLRQAWTKLMPNSAAYQQLGRKH